MKERFNEFYDHPFTVSNLIKDIKIDMLLIHNNMHSSFVTTDSNEIHKYHLRVTELEQDILNKLSIVEERFLGDTNKVIELRSLFFESIESHHEVINLILEGNTDEAELLEEQEKFRNEGPKDELMKEISLIAEYKAELFHGQALESFNAQKRGFVIILIISLLLFLLISALLTRNISNPIRKLSETAEIADDPDIEIDLDTDRKDELGKVARSFKEMIERSRRRQRVQVEALEKSFQDLFRNMPIGAVMLAEQQDGEIRIERANGRFFDIFNLGYDSLDNENPVNTFDIPNRVISQMFPLDSRNQMAANLYINELDRYIETYAYESTTDNYLMLVKDITNEVKARKTIEEMNKDLENKVTERTRQLEESNNELRDFSYSISHDLRAPLRHITGYIDLLDKKHRNELSDGGKRYIEIIKGAAVNMGSLIDDLLKFFRMGKMELIIADFDNNALVNDVLDSLGAYDGNIEIIVGELGTSRGDRELIKIVWQNLIDNAIKYSSKAEKPRIEIGKKKTEKGEAFYVKDNGVGFDMQYYDKIFAVFQRLHKNEEFTGTGIGLANTKRVINKHGGEIWAEAEVNKGACFYFII